MSNKTAFLSMLVAATLIVMLHEPVWSGAAIVIVPVSVGILIYMALWLSARRKQHLTDLHRLQVAYDQLDQQTKLIIRTDMELHSTQEELDRRLASLMSLHRLGQELEVSLRPEEVYSKLNASLVTNLGFSTAMLGICPSFTEVNWCALIGISSEAAGTIQRHLISASMLKQILSNPKPRNLHVASVSDPAVRKLLTLLGVTNAVVAGITPHAGPAGCLLLGRAGSGMMSAQADAELVAILSNQLATAVENSQLLEQTWSSQQELQRKVQQRTQELAQLNAELVQLNNSKSDFVSSVSHELRTPLAAIKGYASLLAAGQFGALSKPQRERVAKIEKHSDALTQLINNLLDIARIESGRVTMDQRTIEVDEFLAGIHDLIHPQMASKQIRYTVDRNGVSQIHGDGEQLQRVFVNLLSNAIKYTPEKGEIRVGFTRSGSTILATVTDTGCGVSTEELPKLFQEFYRSNAEVNQRVRGTGLGLALVKRIVEAHQGQISVTSVEGKGSTFTVQLPVR